MKVKISSDERDIFAAIPLALFVRVLGQYSASRLPAHPRLDSPRQTPAGANTWRVFQ
jgi:hypothetical protein